jgi:hypothetical protein
MKTIRRSAILLVLVLFSTPLLSGQDLASYRKFALGSSVVAVSKQVGQDPLRADLIHQSPALIQQITYWPIETTPYSTHAESVSQVQFSFYNGELYKISVTYDQQATEGLTEDDMVAAISARYGTATRLYPEIALPTTDEYAPSSKVIARWEDAGTSVSLFRTNSLNTFGLAVYSKQVDAQADAAIIESAKLEKQEAPQKEIDRQKGEADKLEAARLKNVKAFRF